MKLNLQQIRSITQGAAFVQEENGYFTFHRFTESQEKVYDNLTKESRKSVMLATAGIKFKFKTNSDSLSIFAKLKSGTSRVYYTMDVFENGKMIGHMSNADALPPVSELKKGIQEHENSISLALTSGEKEICVYFPWSVIIEIKEVCLSDGAWIEPVKCAKKIIMFGDSITQGYDAYHPSKSYASRLCDTLGVEGINKAIGGEVHFPELSALRDDIEPEMITVALGANDWLKVKPDDFPGLCKSFYENLTKNYPDTPIVTITPIWRADEGMEGDFGKFSRIEDTIRKVTSDFPNVRVIRGYDLVPHDTSLYTDFRLHPNDEGFAHYATNLVCELTIK